MLTDEGLTNAELVHNALLANFAYADDDPSVIELRDAVLEALTAANRLIPEGAEWGDEYGSITASGDVINEFRGPNYATHEREYWIGPWREVRGDE